MAVSPDSIVEDLDVIENIGTGVYTTKIDLSFDPLLLQTAEEGFSDDIVLTSPPK